MNLRLPRLSVAFLFAATALAQSPAKTADEALALLRAGNDRFAADNSVTPPLGEATRRTLTQGQQPYAIVLCCADSRVPPEYVFNTGLGELFVVRVAGNTCDIETLASIEYAAEHLGAQLCVVLGHESCGAVKAAIEQITTGHKGLPAPAPSPAIGALLAAIQPVARSGLATQLIGKELFVHVEEDNARLQAAECLRRSPTLQELAKAGRFRMQAARYHLDTGVVEFLPEKADANKTKSTVAPPAVPPQVALQTLQAGNQRFVADGKPAADISLHRRVQLTRGQRPPAVVVTCADSRVPPELLFDAGFGEVFVVRVAGNVCNDDVLGSIEYAVEHLGASCVVVMGHSQCGAVKAALAGGHDEHLSPNLRALLARIEPSIVLARATGKDGEELLAQSVECNVQRFLADARGHSEILRHLEHAGKLRLVPAVYDLATGQVTWLPDAPEAAETEAHPAPAGEGHAPPVPGKVEETEPKTEPGPAPTSGAAEHETGKPAAGHGKHQPLALPIAG